MDRRNQYNRPRQAGSMDGFINRRGRTINDPFNKKVADVNSIQGSSKVLGQTGKRAATNPLMPAAVTWTPRIQDPSAVELTHKNKRKPKTTDKKRTWKKIAKKSGLGVLAIALIIGGYLGFKFFHNIDEVFGGNVFSNISSLFGTTTLKGESSGRVNILLAGDSSDDPGHPGADLTDSVMIVSINTKNNTGFLLSIPRDLWVNVPGSSNYTKINVENTVTNFNAAGYPSNGMGQLEQVVNQDLGIPTDYYALINYTAFRDAVNAVGGITVNINTGDPRGLFDPNISVADGGPLKLPNGNDFLNGQTALNLARARGDPCYCGQYAYGFPNSDFDRTQHQREMLVALAQKSTTIGVVSNPVKIGQLFDSIGNNVKTDLTLADVIKLAQLAKASNLAHAQSLTYSYGGSSPLLTGATEDGQDALIPTAGVGNYNQLQLYYQQLTSANPVVREGATTVILNGGNTVGLAKDYEQSLTKLGVDVASVADASTIYPQTQIMDNSGGSDPNTRAALEKVFGTNIIANNPTINTSNAKFVVILGENQGLPSSSN